MEGDIKTRKRILFICGSLRKKSLNRQVGEEAMRLIGSAAETRWLDYADLPYMNQDAEFPTPVSVQRVRNEVLAADALWICSPEYNKSIPGVLKNCLDWLSRSVASGSADTAFKNKLVTFSCAGGGFVARYVAAALAETLSFMGADLILATHAQIALNRQDYTTDVLTLSPEERCALKSQADILLANMGVSRTT